MKKLSAIIIAIILSNTLIAGKLCIKFKKIPENFFSSFEKELKEYSKQQYGIENFNIDTTEKKIVGEKTFKVKKRRKKNFLVGTPTETFKKKPKWKKENIKIIGEINNNSVCVSVILKAYNKRTKKWHNLDSDYLLEEHMGAFAITNILKGKNFWSIGNIIIDENGVQKRIPNLTQFTFDSVDTSIDRNSGIKTVNFYLRTKNNMVVYRVLMLGEVKNINNAINIFKSHFLDYNPVKKIPKIYDFYWAYAKHGEIMDGMHKLQVITALGFPTSIIKKDASSEIYVYNFDGKKYKYTIVNNELTFE